MKILSNHAEAGYSAFHEYDTLNLWLRSQALRGNGKMRQNKAGTMPNHISFSAHTGAKIGEHKKSLNYAMVLVNQNDPS